MSTRLRATHIFSVPGSGVGIDEVHPITGNGVWSGDTPAQIAERAPGAVPTPWEEIERLNNENAREAPHRVDADRWNWALNVLPPQKWVRESGAETFHISELITGNIGTILARIGDIYYEMADDVSLSHHAIIAKCLESDD